MKKLLIILAAIAAISCSDNQTPPPKQQQSTKQCKAKSSSSININEKAIEKILVFYRDYVFGKFTVTDDVITQYCTKSLAQKLRDDYDKEFSDGGGYAVWKFRSGAQDGEDIQEIEKIEALGDNKYFVYYNDMGNKGTRTITIVVDGEKILFDKLQ